MEDLGAQQQCNKSSKDTLPEITQYGIRLPFRVAVVGQTDSGKTHSIMHRWLGGKISYWRPNEDGSPSPASLQHCLFCSNSSMSLGEKENLVRHFISNPQQQLFHVSRFPTKQEVFEFISMTANVVGGRKTTNKEEGDVRLVAKQDPEAVVFNEDDRTAPNRVIAFDDLMTEAFTNRDNEATMNLITTKLSHHNNTSILSVTSFIPKEKIPCFSEIK